MWSALLLYFVIVNYAFCKGGAGDKDTLLNCSGVSVSMAYPL